MSQVMMINSLGQIVSEFRDDSPIKLSNFGKVNITRFSEVIFNESIQRWYVSFRDGAPEEWRGRNLTQDLLNKAAPQIEIPTMVCTYISDCGEDIPAWSTYKEAVNAERIVLVWMIREGMFS